MADQVEVANQKIAVNKDLTRAEKKARIAQIVDRGYVNDRLNATNIPEGMHGQWVRADDMEIDRMKMYGYEMADPKKFSAAGMSSHGDGTVLKLGDVVLMVCSAEDHEIHEEVRREKFHDTYVKKSQAGIKLQDNFKSLESAGITLDDRSEAAQKITNPKDI